MKTDGTQSEILYSISSPTRYEDHGDYYYISSIKYHDGRLYFSQIQAGGGEGPEEIEAGWIYRMKTDGSNRTSIYHTERWGVGDFHILGNRIYFQPYEFRGGEEWVENEYFISILLDGKSNITQNIGALLVNNVTLLNGRIYVMADKYKEPWKYTGQALISFTPDLTGMVEQSKIVNSAVNKYELSLWNYLYKDKIIYAKMLSNGTASLCNKTIGDSKETLLIKTIYSRSVQGRIIGVINDKLYYNLNDKVYYITLAEKKPHLIDWSRESASTVMLTMEEVKNLIKKYFEKTLDPEGDIISITAFDETKISDSSVRFDLRAATKSAEHTHQANTLIGTIIVDLTTGKAVIEYNGGAKETINLLNIPK